MTKLSRIRGHWVLQMSYLTVLNRMLQNVTERWKRTTAWEEIVRKKVIICEPKNSAEFESSMRHFYEVKIFTKSVLPQARFLG